MFRFIQIDLQIDRLIAGRFIERQIYGRQISRSSLITPNPIPLLPPVTIATGIFRSARFSETENCHPHLQEEPSRNFERRHLEVHRENTPCFVHLSNLNTFIYLKKEAQCVSVGQKEMKIHIKICFQSNLSFYVSVLKSKGLRF